MVEGFEFGIGDRYALSLPRVSLKPEAMKILASIFQKWAL